jgi:hypothetical protein
VTSYLKGSLTSCHETNSFLCVVSLEVLFLRPLADSLSGVLGLMTKIVSTRFVHKQTVQILLGCPKIYCFHLSASLQTLCQRHLCKYLGQAHVVIGPWLGLNGMIGIWKKECWWNLGCLLLWHLTTLQCKVQFLFFASLCHLICMPGPRAFYEAI